MNKPLSATSFLGKVVLEQSRGRDGSILVFFLGETQKQGNSHLNVKVRARAGS